MSKKRQRKETKIEFIPIYITDVEFKEEKSLIIPWGCETLTGGCSHWKYGGR